MSLIVSIPHSLGKQEALRRLKSGMARVLGSIPGLKMDEPTRSGDRISFRVSGLGQVASETVDVAEDSVRLEVMLPLLLQKFAQIVQRAMTEGARRLLEKK
jgi:Putative polyhydroxyalkanoic acid system protein (PHA_gran_rgn)